ncbi:MAG: hypothetical protein WDO19_28550 [Bacteroidota bacterium]
MQTFCTIITADYFPKAVVLYKSIKTYNKEITLQVLVSDNKPITTLFSGDEGLTIITTAELSEYPLVDSLYKKYAHINFDDFRWSMKPVFASYLLRSGYNKIIYLDCDMFFVNDYNFLLDELDNYQVLLTPHWKNTNPLVDKKSFFSNFTHGIFPAGFFAANKKALAALDWWANACHFMMGDHPDIGIHDDQRYLDIFPVLFENTKIIRHRGCNIGAWNYEESARTLVNGEVLINEKYPVIFIHFDEMLISTILKGHDPYLAPYLNKYREAFKTSGYLLSDFIPKLDFYTDANLLIKMKWTLKLRTRIKRFLYKLAESL